MLPIQEVHSALPGLGFDNQEVPSPLTEEVEVSGTGSCVTEPSGEVAQARLEGFDVSDGVNRGGGHDAPPVCRELLRTLCFAGAFMTSSRQPR